MPTVNELLQAQATMLAYIQLRNAPRDRIMTGVRPNAEVCLADYARLQIALTGGGDGIPDISSLAEDFATVTASVTPFITLMQLAMHIIIDTPKIIDQAAAAQGMSILPFGVDLSQPLSPASYAAMLQDAAAAIQALAVPIQVMQDVQAQT